MGGRSKEDSGIGSSFNSKDTWNVDRILVSFYFTSFPDDIDSKRLWTICDKYGVVSDVYMACKLSNLGKKFSFVGFIKVVDQRALESKLHEIWIGKIHLFVSISQFGRDNVNTSKPQVHSQISRDKGMVNGGGFGSYANVVKSGIVTDQSKNLKAIVLQESDITNPQSLSPSVLEMFVMLKIPQTGGITWEEGFPDIQIQYVCGDYWFYVSFDLEKDCSRFKKSKHVHAYFSTFRPMVNGFIVKERVDWIELMGLPCCAWNDGDVSKVENIWGVFLRGR